jgi:hypothetical protein
MTAKLVNSTPAEIIALAERNWSAGQISEHLSEPVANVVDVLRNRDAQPSKPTPTAAQPSPVRPAAAPIRPLGTGNLLQRAELSTSKRTKALGARIAGDLDRLAVMLDDGQRTEAEAAKAAEVRRAARAEVDELEKQLAAAKAKLRPRKKASAPAQTRPAPFLAPASKLVRQWAAKQGIDVAPTGRVPSSVIDAYNISQAAS